MNKATVQLVIAVIIGMALYELIAGPLIARVTAR